jgi:hypothetical protein
VRAISATIAMLAISLSGAAQCTDEELRLQTVRRQLAEQYVRIETANKKKDVAALLALRAPNCSANGPGGTHSNCVDMENYTKQLISEIGTVASLTNTILALRVENDTALATVAQHFVRTQMKLGKLRNTDTSAIQDETWVHTSEGWQLQLVANVHSRRWYVDGKRIDPHKPFDPDAPPYNPSLSSDE